MLQVRLNPEEDKDLDEIVREMDPDSFNRSRTIRQIIREKAEAIRDGHN